MDIENQEVLALKYQQTRFGYMDENEAFVHVKALALKICIITGWQLPESQEYMMTFIDQLSKMFKEQYSTLNPAEVEYAMRRYGIGTKDWGKSMNLTLIDEPVKKYLSLRSEASKWEEQAAIASEVPKESLQIDFPTDWSGEWFALKEMAKNGQINKLSIPIPVSMYGWLEREGKIDLSIEEKKEHMKSARAEYIEELNARSYGDLLSMDEANILRCLVSDDWYGDLNVRELVKIRAKILAVKQLAMSEAMNDI